MENQILNQHLIDINKENLKTKYKNQRLQEAQQIYLCECQKIYLSFPALYLHVRNKHQIKLTTKINDKICKIQQKDGKTYITYFLVQQQEIQQKKDDSYNSEEAKKSSKNEPMRTFEAYAEDQCYFNQENLKLDENSIMTSDDNAFSFFQIKNIIFEYLAQLTYENIFLYQNSAKILSHFLEYLKICSQNSKQFDQFHHFFQVSIFHSLPLFFNQFICYYLPLIDSSVQRPQREMRAYQQIMKNFGNWMRQKQYTNLIIF